MSNKIEDIYLLAEFHANWWPFKLDLDQQGFKQMLGINCLCKRILGIALILTASQMAAMRLRSSYKPECDFQVWI